MKRFLDLTALRNFKAFLLIALMTLATVTNARSADVTEFYRVFFNTFKAQVKSNNTIVLRWTATEYNNKCFVVQHSTNGVDWVDIDSVKSKRSLESLEGYSYTHYTKLTGKHYYRIMDVDTDEVRAGYSEVIIVNMRNENEKQVISPNPATNQLTIVSQDANTLYTTARIYDLMGKQVTERTLRSQTNTISISDLPSGIYIVTASGANGISHTQKIVKQ
ncbi:MAG: T9SS type A sorting domain-containing protein [Chitinophagaceae bacterium]|nr:T9SS type A sorting domain-containing protein [Chitinophagaceae bacterium]